MNKRINKINSLLGIYGEGCWMGYTICPDNPYTYHHIKKDCDGGKSNLANGALLSRCAHEDLNEMEIRLNQYYIKLNKLFRLLNDTKRPPTIEYYIELNRILRKVNSIMKLSEYYNPKRELTFTSKEESETSNGIVVLQKRFTLLT